MNPHFVRKRKDDSICGPYESSKKCLRPSVIISKLPTDQEIMLNDLTITWRTLTSTPIQWNDINESNNVLEYLTCIKETIFYILFATLELFLNFFF